MGQPHDAPLIEALEAIVRRVVRAELAERLPPPSPYMTVPEAAEYLRCSRQRVDDLLSAGRLERVKDGGRTLVRRRDVERWLGER
jgi:excisionase family DNA binding protein